MGVARVIAWLSWKGERSWPNGHGSMRSLTLDESNEGKYVMMAAREVSASSDVNPEINLTR